MNPDTTQQLTRESLLRLRAIDSGEMTETTWGDFIDSNGLSFEETSEIRAKLLAGRKAVFAAGESRVFTLFWPPRKNGDAVSTFKLGPLACARTLGDPCRTRVYDQSTGQTIANMAMFDLAKEKELAHLFASSPDLLAALESAEAKLNQLLASRTLDSTDAPFHVVRKARDTITAAIARAKGIT